MAHGVILGQTPNTNNLLPLDGSRAMTGALNMASHKITNLSNGTANNDAVNYYQLMNSTVSASRISGTLSTSNIPNLSASKITSGTFSASRIPDLDASQITSGQFNTARIPNLSASKITSGILSVANGGTGVSSLDALLTGLGVHNYVFGDYNGGDITNLPFAPRFLVLCGEYENRAIGFRGYGYMVAVKPSSKNQIGSLYVATTDDNLYSWPSNVFAEVMWITFNSNNIEVDGVSIEGSYFAF